MFSFVTRLCQRPFILGMAIGLVFNIHLIPLVRASAIPTLDTSCTQTLSVPAEVQQWIDLQCAVNSAIFGDGLEPSAGYAMDTAVEAPGFYTGQTYDGRPIELDVVWTVAADLENEAPELATEGVTAHFVIALMSGVGGDVPIAGVVMQTGPYTLDEGYVLIVCDILCEAEFALFQDAALLDQGMQVWNVSTNEVGPLDTLDPDALTLWSPGFDPSTFIQATPGGTPGSIGIGLDCIEAADEILQIDLNAAQERLASCVTDAMAAFAVALGLCALAAVALVNPLSFFINLACVALAAALLAGMLRGCAHDLMIDMAAAYARYRVALQQCGVLIL